MVKKLQFKQLYSSKFGNNKNINDNE